MLRVLVLRATCTLFLLSAFGSAQQADQTPPPVPGSPEDLVQQGEKLSREGKQDEALALYNKVLDKSPDYYGAHLAAGAALDLKGDYAGAQEHFTKAIEVAPSDSKQQAQRALAFSYAFAGDPYKAGESEAQVLNARLAKGDSVAAAETCNELGRIYIEAGDADHAFKGH